MATTTYKRKQFLVDGAYQFKFVTRLFVGLFGIAIVAELLTMAVLWQYMSQPGFQHQPPLIAALVGVAATVLIQFVLALPIVYYLGVRQSHKIVGPLWRIKRTLEAYANGDFSKRLTLRDGDTLLDLAHAINRMAEQLEHRYPRHKQ